MYKTRTICRACEFGTPTTASGAKASDNPERLMEVFDLGIQPMANDFARPGEEQKGYAPLKVMYCPQCTLAQLSVVVDPKILYSNYPYITSRSQTMLDHFRSLWDMIQFEKKVTSVLEIGSNDGWFLKYCLGHGAESALGIDPAENLRPEPFSGITNINGLFDEESARIAQGSMPIVDVIVARHVFAHIDDWKSFIRNLDILAGKDTLIVIECPYVGNLLERCEFDTIYHEHLSYISLRAISHLLKNSPFHLHKVQSFPIHGGAMVFMIRRNDCGIEPDPGVEEFLAVEEVRLKDWVEFNKVARLRIHEMKSFVREHLDNGSKICGFGASAKSTVWVNACGFTRKQISFIADSTKLKWGGFSPGTDIPIVDEGALLRDEPDYAICFAWNFFDEIRKTQSLYLRKGGNFAVPINGIQVVGHEESEIVNPAGKV